MTYSQHEIARFWAKVDKSGECWLWTSTTRDGYGIFQVKIGGIWKCKSAHRMSYELANNITLESRYDLVCHRCDNPPCVRPDHLFLGSHQDNTDDMYNKGRRERKKPYQKKETRKAVKLSHEQYLEILEALQKPYYGIVNSLAHRYGVSHSLISRIKTGSFVPAAISVHENN